MRTVADKRAVVTGAASGIGRALAVALAKSGADVVVTDRDTDRLGPVVDEIRAAGRAADAFGFDVADKAAWEPFRDAVLARGPVDLVVNNAGVSLTGPFLECSLEDLEWQIGINLWGVIHGCRAFLPHLLTRPDAHLVNVSSLFGILTVPDSAAYCVSKHAVRSLTEALEMELHGSSVHFSSVHPGAVATGIVSGGRYRAGGHVSEGGARKLIDRGMTPDAAAARILKGILRDERRILVGSDAVALATMVQLFPVFYRRIVTFALRRRRATPG